MPKNLLGDGLVEAEEGGRGTGAEVGAAGALEHGLDEAVLAWGAVEVEHGEVVLLRQRNQVVEVCQQVAEADLVAEIFQGAFHPLGASEGNLALTGPSASNQKNLHEVVSPIALTAPFPRLFPASRTA